MKTLLKLTVITLFLSVLSCKKESKAADFDYKYLETENVLNCTNVETQLYYEALMSFEDDILKTYNTRNTDLRVAYTNFFRLAQRNGVNYQELASPHSMEVFEALKNDSDLWTDNNKLNYNADIFTCIGENLNDKGLATTYKALISTNSMRPELFGAPLLNKIKTANSDRYLATYVALDLFYSNLFNVDSSKVTENIPPEIPKYRTEPGKPIIKLDSKSEAETNEDEHAGHNHE
jgi:hypothetical protein